MFDFIGDIHGHADELVALLKKLGYRMSGGIYHHTERKAFFAGDFIDRGPKIREALRIVRSMVLKWFYVLSEIFQKQIPVQT